MVFRILGQLPPRKIAPNPKTNPKLNPNPNRETIFFGGNCLVAPNPKTNPDFDPNPIPNRGEFSLGGNSPDTGFQSSILHKLKSTRNCRFKLNKDNDRSFLVAYTTSIK